MGRHGEQNDEEARPHGEGEGAERDRHDREPRREASRTNRIDESTARHLTEKTDEAAHREGETDVGLRPLRLREVHGEERTEPGLEVRDEEREGVEPAAASHRNGLHVGRSLSGHLGIGVTPGNPSRSEFRPGHFAGFDDASILRAGCRHLPGDFSAGLSGMGVAAGVDGGVTGAWTGAAGVGAAGG